MNPDLWHLLDCASAVALLLSALTLAALAIRDAVRAWREGGER